MDFERAYISASDVSIILEGKDRVAVYTRSGYVVEGKKWSVAGDWIAVVCPCTVRREH